MNKTQLAIIATVIAGSIGIGMIGCAANQETGAESKTVQKTSSEKKTSTNEKTTDSDKDSAKTADAEIQETSDSKKEQSTEKTVETNNSDSANKDNSNQKAADSKTEQANSQTSGDKTESKPASNSKPSSSVSSGTSKPSGSSSNSTTSNSKPSTANKPSTNAHSHSWEPVYKTVHHPEEGHNEQYVIKEAWTEQIPIYGLDERMICNGCGVDKTDWSLEQDKQHTIANADTNPKCGAWHSEFVQIVTGYDTITHPAQYGTRWVVDKAAWTEKVVSGYKCSCGAIK
ncbi:hypothetical protein [Faecalibaculum rodentium]|uniref:hypothetical protein n=1 Tax=Faecalibaculum rodentium TaxID=1702221 RepID=UPI0023F47FC7|nr:hypothetical protein [Faecalibaculum rodentium]